MRLGDLCPDLALTEAKLDGRTDVLLRARIIDHRLVMPRGGHLDIPCDFVVGAEPVCKERAVGRSGTSLDAAVRDAVACGQKRCGELRIADGERPFVFFGFRQHVIFPAGNGLSELCRDFRLVLRDVRVLPRIGRHVEQFARMIEPVALRTDADAAPLVREDHAVRPASGLSEKKRFETDPVERLGTHDGNAGRVRQCREQVDRTGDLRDLRARLDMPGPPNDKGDADAALIGRAFASFHAAVPSPAIGPVVTEIDYDGLLGHL